jgi:hypothetical protein
VKKNRITSVLGLILALTLLIGIVSPLPSGAAAVELTVLNPKGLLTQASNMPLADRQPLLDKLEAGEDIELLVMHYSKSPDAAITWGVGLMLKDYWEEEYDVTVNITAIQDNTGTWMTDGTPPPVGSPWGAKSGKNHTDYQPLGEVPFARYQAWAGFDAVLFGTAD